MSPCCLFTGNKKPVEAVPREKLPGDYIFHDLRIYAVLEQSPMNPILNPFILLTANLIYKEYQIRENRV